MHLMDQYKNTPLENQFRHMMGKISELLPNQVSVDLGFGIWHNTRNPEEYELLFDYSFSNYILEREWHKGQQMKQSEDGSVYLKFASNQKKQILSWVLGFGPAVKVLAPESLKAEVVESAKKVIGRYEV